MAALALPPLLAARYTLAFLANSAYANSDMRNMDMVNDSFQLSDK